MAATLSLPCFTIASSYGAGTLTYVVDEKGVKFEFDAPNTADGDKALELVRRGDLSGCSFAFTTHYWNKDFVERTAKVVNGFTEVTYTVKAVTGVYDFTLAADPAYPDTSVDAREFTAELRKPAEPNQELIREQVQAMRRAASMSL